MTRLVVDDSVAPGGHSAADRTYEETAGLCDLDDSLDVDDLREATERVILQKWKENNQRAVFLNFGDRAGVVRFKAEKWNADSPNIIKHRVEQEFDRAVRITEAQWRALRSEWREMCEVSV